MGRPSLDFWGRRGSRSHDGAGGLTIEKKTKKKLKIDGPAPSSTLGGPSSRCVAPYAAPRGKRAVGRQAAESCSSNSNEGEVTYRAIESRQRQHSIVNPLYLGEILSIIETPLDFRTSKKIRKILLDLLCTRRCQIVSLTFATSATPPRGAGRTE